MKLFTIVGLALVACSVANGLALKGNAPRLAVQSQQQQQEDLTQQEEISAPSPYQFSYDTQTDGSSSGRTESGDANGKVIGQYSIKGADGIQRIVSYTADSEGFRANISTNEPGTESQNPSFIVLQSSQLPAAEISKQLQAEVDAQQEEQPLEEAELPAAPAKTVAAPRKAPASAPRKSKPAAQVSVPVKSKRPAQIAAPAKKPVSRPVARQPAPAKAPAATRSRGPSKSPATTTTQRPRQVAAAPSKKLPQLPAAEEPSEDAQLSLSADQEESAEDDAVEGF